MGLVLAGLSGCSAISSAKLPPLPPGASQPFDLFLRNDYNLIEDAITQLFVDCMSEAGFSQHESVSPGESRMFARLGEKPLSPRTEPDALKYGFGAPVPAEPAKIIWNDAAYNSAVDNCEITTRKELGDLQEVEDLRYKYANLGNAIANELGARAESILDDSSQVMTDCLAGKGHALAGGGSFDLDAGPEQFGIKLGKHADPSPGFAARPAGLPGNATFFPGTSPREYIPTPEESTFAVAFVRCGNDTGLFNEIDSQIESIQQDIIEDHAAEFAELNPKVEAVAKRAAEALGR